MRNPDAVMIILGASAACVMIVHTIANTIIRLRQHSRPPHDLQPALSDDRMARLEAAVESIAIEVERISEGQRFTTRLLSDISRPIAPPRSTPGIFDTPH